jgi:acyl transferase domain-containing protein/thioesterase domain-containing protein/SAM-dependent methyltransferase
VSDSSTYTITALDSDLNGIQADLSSHRIVSKVLEIHGRYHTSVHEKSADTLATLCEKHETLRASKGFKTDLRQVLQEILCLTSNWNLTLLQTLHSVRNGTGYIVSVGPVSVITDSMVKAHQIKIVHTHKILNIESSAETAFKYPEHAVAIVGIGCRFSGASSPEEFWQLLINGQSMATKVPVQRFSPDALDRGQANLGKHYWGNFIANVDDFDHKFFGKSSREAATMDPQQRLLLEVTYQAVESAGWLGQARLNHPKEDVGCFVGCGSSDYNDNIACHTPGAFSILGSLRGLLSGRISHHFGWEAPSGTYDTACASSMVAIHAACTALQLGECSAAVAGGVNVLTSPAYFQNLDAAGFLSRSGASTAFDARASGYCRGDGAGMVVLKRLRDALAHGDAIQGVIAATSVNQNRNETSINVPSMKSQVKLFQKVLDHAHLKGEQVTFVEAHGTGTQVGDCIEAESIRQVFGTGYRHDTLHLGSVKDNIGHTEGAAGVASLIKALLMIRHSTIAPQAGFQTLNAKIPPFEENNIQIPQKPLEWKTAFKAACVNNYGAGGCNAALVVCQPLATPSRPHQRLGKYPIFVSAKTEVSLKAYCRKLLRWLDAPLSLHGNDKLLAHLAYNLSQKQNRDLTYSIASDVADIGELGNFLRTYLDNPQAAQSLNLSSASALRPRPLVLLFGGQTGTDFKLSPSVLKSCRLIRTHLFDCDTALKRLGYEGIFPAIHSSEDHDLVTSHSILFSIQYASAKCWIDSGLKIDALLGHSFGHYTALCISGVLTLEHALKLVAGRAKLIKSAWGPEKGTMIALETDTDKLAWLLETMNQKFPNNGIEVACYNSSSSYVLVGTAASINAVEKILHTRSSSTPVIKSKRLDIPYGFHSRLTDPVLPALTALAESLTYSTPRIPVASSLGEGSFPSQENAKGIVMHTRSPVQFARATEKLSSKLGQCTWLETGTGSLITGMVRRAIGGSADSEHIFQPVNLEESLNSLAHATIILWKHGHGHSFWPFHSSQREEYEDLHLPPYSFETIPHWLPYTSTSNSTYTSAVEKKSAHYCKFERFANPDCKEAIFKVASDAISFKSMVEGHAVLGNPLCPASVYVDIAVQAAKNLASRGNTPELSEMRFDLCHLNIEAPLGIDSSTTINASLTHNDTEPSRWAFELTSADQVNDVIRHATGDIILHCRADVQTSDLFSSYSRLLDIGLCRNILNDSRAHSVSGPVIYTLFDKVVTYKPFYQGLRRIASLDREVAAQVMLPSERVVTNDHSTFAPVAVDCFLQVAGVQVNFLQETLRDEVYIASKMERILSEDEFPFSKAGREWTVYSKCSTPDDHSVVNDIFVFDSQTEKLVMVLCGVQFSRVPIRSLTKMLARASGVQLDAKKMPSALVREQMPIINEVASKSHVRNGSSVSPNDLNKVLSNLLEVPEETLHPWDTFDDLGIDSLMITELANVVLHSFGVTLSTSELQSLGNIRSLASRLSMRTNTKISPVDTHEDSDSSTESYQESNDGVLFASTSQSSAEISLVDTYSAYDAHAVFKDASLQFDTFAKANSFDGYWQDVYPIHSRLIVAYLTEALSALGCPLATQEAGSHIPWPDHHPRHKKLVARLFEILEHMKLIRKVGENEFVRTAVVVESTSPQELHETIEKLYPAYAQEHRLLQITGARFADCLSGTTDAVDLLFGTKMNKSLLEDVYSNAPIFKTATGFLAQYLAVALPTCYPGECVEILEIGAGTGGTTRELVDVLLRAGVNFKYTFTDISTSMVFKAKQKFKDLSNMQFQVLNIEDQSPVALHRRFHAVLSTNCIHATSNLVDSCRNIRSMLKPGGFTALIELTRKMPWYDLVFGLLEGWWAFSDDRTHALVDENVWSEKLQMASFESVAWSSGTSEESCDIRVICGFNSASSDKTPASLGYQASSVLLQGHLDQAEETVFAFPGGFGTASTYTTLPALHNSIAVIGLNSPFLHSPSAFTVTLPELTSLYVSEIQRYQPSGPYTLMGYSVGGVMAYEAAYQLISRGEQVKKLILLDSASPARFPPFPVGLLDFFDNINRFSGTSQSESPSTSPVKGTSANQAKKMGDPHVVATLECLRTYNPQPLPEGYSPQTLVVAARYGVDRTKSITRPAVCETEQIVMEWVLDDRKDFGPRGFGWDRIIPSDMIEVVSVDGNHFSLMTEPSVSP